VRAVISLKVWQAIGLGLVLVVVTVLLVIWWRQRNYRWPLILGACLIVAVTLSWWSGEAFVVNDYRAGCDGLCPGFRGAPIPTYAGAAAGEQFLPGGFLLNSLVYLVLILGWSVLLRGIMEAGEDAAARSPWFVVIVGLVLVVAPLVLSPLLLPPPEAHVRGDPQRIAINARREVYLYDHQAPSPILRVSLEDVRPRPDGQPGMRVCLSIYTFLYMPIGHMFLDMTPEGVHSNAGGILPRPASCWE
jgi:hypothetical protein